MNFLIIPLHRKKNSIVYNKEIDKIPYQLMKIDLIDLTKKLINWWNILYKKNKVVGLCPQRLLIIIIYKLGTIPIALTSYIPT